MTILTRPQLVLKSLQADGQDMTHMSVEITKTATMSYGSLLKADAEEATAAELADGAWDVSYIIDDLKVEDLEVGDTMLARCVSQPQFLILRGELIKLGDTPLDAGELALYVAGAKPVEIQ
ncbi:hypothetical protein [Vibrio phage RYC]|nr:hypothetical protein [Vibrio phage RYC]